MTEIMQCKYSCSRCGIKDQVVSVESRPSNMNVVYWMENFVIIALGKDHFNRSPHCHPEKLENIMIPINKDDNVENNWIGKAIKR